MTEIEALTEVLEATERAIETDWSQKTNSETDAADFTACLNARRGMRRIKKIIEDELKLARRRLAIFGDA